MLVGKLFCLPMKKLKGKGQQRAKLFFEKQNSQGHFYIANISNIFSKNIRHNKEKLLEIEKSSGSVKEVYDFIREDRFQCKVRRSQSSNSIRRHVLLKCNYIY